MKSIDLSRIAAAARPRSTVRGVVALQLVANGLGAAAVLAYLHLLFPGLSGVSRGGGVDGVVLGAYIVAIVLLVLPLNALMLQRVMRWVREGRPPTPTERRWALVQPIAQSVASFCVWLGAGLIYAVFNHSQHYAPRVAFGIVLAGLVTCAVLELLLSRHFRPVFALALQHAPMTRWRREVLTRVMMAWVLGSAMPLAAVGVGLRLLPDDELAVSVPRFSILLFTAIVVGGAVICAAVLTVSGSLERVTEALRRVQAGDLDVELPVTNIGEVGRLQHGVNDMVRGLRERRQLQDLFGRQIGVDVALALEREPRLGGERREITALFVDLEGFTAFTESHSPEQVVRELNMFFAVVITAVSREGGWVHKFEGDAALCIFGAPTDQPDHAARALRAAAALPAAVAALPQAPRVGIGVASGHVVVGNIGTPERYEYTVIGDAVNVAARLVELAKRDYAGVLASEETVQAAGPDAEAWAEAGTVVLRGRSQPTGLYQPVVVRATAPGTVTGGPSPTGSPDPAPSR